MKIVIDVDTDNPIHHAEGTDYFMPDLHAFISENILKIFKEKGKVLPKDHGRLIDEDEITVEEDVYNQKYIIHAPTIIEADGGSK